MRWKSSKDQEDQKKLITISDKPNIPHSKEIISFAYLPVKIGTTYVWLERYIQVHTYEEIRMNLNPKDDKINEYVYVGWKLKENKFYNI